MLAQVGDIKTAKELGYSGWDKRIYVKCSGCQDKRWLRLVYYNKGRRLCKKCTAKYKAKPKSIEPIRKAMAKNDLTTSYLKRKVSPNSKGRFGYCLSFPGEEWPKDCKNALVTVDYAASQVLFTPINKPVTGSKKVRKNGWRYEISIPPDIASMLEEGHVTLDHRGPIVFLQAQDNSLLPLIEQWANSGSGSTFENQNDLSTQGLSSMYPSITIPQTLWPNLSEYPYVTVELDKEGMKLLPSKTKGKRGDYTYKLRKNCARLQAGIFSLRNDRPDLPEGDWLLVRGKSGKPLLSKEGAFRFRYIGNE